MAIYKKYSVIHQCSFQWTSLKLKDEKFQDKLDSIFNTMHLSKMNIFKSNIDFNKKVR